MKKTILLALFVLMGVGLLNAQTKVTGKVTSADDGQPLPYVTIVVKGTSALATSGVDGKYSITIPEGHDVLTFSFSGMQTEDVKVGGRSIVDMALTSDATVLDDAVIVAYGSTSKKNIISSVSKVSSDELKQLSVASVDMALQGSAPGLVVTQNAGSPGAGNTVRVRGFTSISGSNDPLYVVDGIPIVTGSFVSDSYGGQGGNTLTNLSPNDIESIQVLKDASATAIYGARASNGVILITTKRGKSGKAKVEINTSYAWQNPIKFYDVMDLGEYLKFGDLAYANTNAAAYGTSRRSFALGYASSPNLDPNSDEMRGIYARTADKYADAIKNKNAPLWQTDISVSGGNESTKYYIGGGIYGQDGVVKGQGYSRRNARVNLDQKAFDWLRLEAGFAISDETVDRRNGDNNIYAPTTTSVLERPGIDLFNADGTYNIKDFSFANPLQQATDPIAETKTERYLGNVGFTANIIDGLKFASKLSTDRIYLNERRYDPANTKPGSTSEGDADFRRRSFDRILSTTTLNYSNTFGKLYMNALAGFEYQRTVEVYARANSTGFPSTKLSWPSSGANPIVARGYQEENRLASYFGRVSFNLDDKYLLEGSIRADGSSKFGKNNRIGYFPAISAGWKVQNETWFNIDAINEFKLKVGYGLTGNEGTVNYPWRTLATVSNYGSASGMAVTQLGDPDLSWESTAQFSAGIDLGFLKDRITFSYEYFNKKTTDLLLRAPLPVSTGFQLIDSNVGDMVNYGHEVTLYGKIIDRQLKWDATFSIATLKNEVTKLYRGPDGVSRPIDAGFASRVAEGQSLGTFYVYKTLGLDANGDVIYDKGADGVLTDDDKYFAGKAIPDYTGSFRTSLSYKGFDLAVFFQFAQGYEIFNNSLAYAGASGSLGFNKFTNQLNYWTAQNTNTNIPRPGYGAIQTNNNRNSDRFVEDGSYVRLKNITIGYNIPETLTKIMKVRVYFGIDNLYTWTDYTGQDPEVSAFGNVNSSMGTDFFTQGANKTVKVGLNITF